jgi:phosphate-selective porin OprO/OprP
VGLFLQIFNELFIKTSVLKSTTGLITILVFLLLNVENLQSQNLVNDKFGKGLTAISKDSTMYVKFGFRFQTLYAAKHNALNSTWEENFLVRRSRLKFDGWVFSPKVIYKLELGLSNRDTRSGRVDESGNTASLLLDAVVKWNFSPGWSLWFGQTKLPGNRERVISSQKLQFVDRSLVNGLFTLDRDIGVQLRHKSIIGKSVFNQAFAVSTGEGRDIIVANPLNGKQYTARVELLPFGEFTSKGDYFGSDLKRERSPKLSIGVTGDYNSNAVRGRGNLGSFVTDDEGKYISSDLATVFVDGIFKYKGLSLASEYAYRSSSDKQESFGYGNGFTGSAGYLFLNNIEIASRYTTITPISTFSGINEMDEYMIGVSKFIVGHSLKIQSDFSYTEVKNDTNFYMVRLQVELAL